MQLVTLRFPAISYLGWKFRGESRADWALLPKAGRKEFFDPDWQERKPNAPARDLGRFNAWRRSAVAITSALPENDFECLAVAQHHGLATRLLDWTLNPLVALFFAVNQHKDHDGAVYFLRLDKVIDTERNKIDEVEGVAWLIVRPMAQRILVQDGIFTFHSPPNLEVASEKLHDDLMGLTGHNASLQRAIIRKQDKAAIERQLSDFGFNHRRLFPDLDGLSRHVNWETAVL